MRLAGRRWDTGELVDVEIEGEHIARISPVESPTTQDASGGSPDVPWIAPGLIDVQVNGYAGQEFSSA